MGFEPRLSNDHTGLFLLDRAAQSTREETGAGSGWVPGNIYGLGCCGVRSYRLACNFSPSPGHRLCGFIAQSTFTPRPGASQRVLPWQYFGAGRGCPSPLHILPLLLFALSHCPEPSGSSVPSAPRGAGPVLRHLPLPQPLPILPLLLPLPQQPLYAELLPPVILFPSPVACFPWLEKPLTKTRVTPSLTSATPPILPLATSLYQVLWPLRPIGKLERHGVLKREGGPLKQTFRASSSCSPVTSVLREGPRYFFSELLHPWQAYTQTNLFLPSLSVLSSFLPSFMKRFC